MSFLANLREKSTAQYTQALCYFLVRAQDDCWQLALKLCELDQGAIKELAGPYSIQRAHFQTPPAFLTRQDILILQALLGAHSIWLEQSQSKELPHNTHSFLEQLADTKKLFLLEEGGRKPAVNIGSELLLPCQWDLDKGGNQTLSLVVTVLEEILFLNEHIFVFDKRNKELRRVLNLDCLVFKTFFKTRLVFDEVASFLVSYQSDFEAKNLPLPRLFSAEAQEGACEPVLIARTVKREGQDLVNELVLAFRYSLDEVCFELSLGESAKNAAVLIGGKIIYAQPDYSKQDKTLINIVKILNSIGPASDAGCWRFNKKSQWQALFYENQKALKDLGVTLSVQAGFAYPCRWRVF